MSENTCIAVDACCDLPDEFLQEHNIRVLPIYLRFGNETFMDNRDPRRTMDFYKHGWLERSLDAQSIPVSADEMSGILEKELVLKFEKVLAITMMHTRSTIYENIRNAVWNSQPKFKELRAAVGLDRRFRIVVVDSNTLFTGPALLTFEAARMLEQEKASVEKVMMRLESIKSQVHAFIIPQDLYHLKNRAGQRGDRSDKSVNWLSYQVGSLLNIKPIILGYRGNTTPVDKAMGFDSALDKVFGSAVDAIEQGLEINGICMSYAGDLAEIRKEKPYQKFIAYAKSRGVPTLLAVMSTSAAINVGPGCFSLAYASRE